MQIQSGLGAYDDSERRDIWRIADGQWFAEFKEGARVFVPKAFKFNRTVAGMLDVNISLYHPLHWQEASLSHKCHRTAS